MEEGQNQGGGRSNQCGQINRPQARQVWERCKRGSQSRKQDCGFGYRMKVMRHMVVPGSLTQEEGLDRNKVRQQVQRIRWLSERRSETGHSSLVCVRNRKGRSHVGKGQAPLPSYRAAVEQLGKNALGIWSAASLLVQERNIEILYGFEFDFYELALNQIGCANYRKKCKMTKDF